jgi:hypothetical protein
MHHVVYLPADRPDIEVCVDGEWWPGELRMWTRLPDGSWTAQATWRREVGMTYVDTFSAEQVRPIEGS